LRGADTLQQAEAMMTLDEEAKHKQRMRVKKAMIDDQKHTFHNSIKARNGVAW
jgi:hypothetical protein